MNARYVNYVHMDSKLQSLPSFYKQYTTSNNAIKVSVYPSNLTSMIKVNEKYETGSFCPMSSVKPQSVKKENIENFAVESHQRKVKPLIPGLLVDSTLRSQSQPRSFKATVNPRSTSTIKTRNRF